MKGQDIILAIEVALTTLGYDLGRKARLYATYGVQELWVVDAARNCTHVHRNPAPDKWGSIEILSARDVLGHAALPGLSVRLDAV